MSFIGFFVSLLALISVNIAALQNSSSTQCTNQNYYVNLCPYENYRFHYAIIGLAIYCGFSSLIFGLILLSVIKRPRKKSIEIRSIKVLTQNTITKNNNSENVSSPKREIKH